MIVILPRAESQLVEAVGISITVAAGWADDLFDSCTFSILTYLVNRGDCNDSVSAFLLTLSISSMGWNRVVGWFLSATWMTFVLFM